MTEAYRDWGIPVWTTGDRMGKAAAVAGYTTNQMAEKFGVTRQTVSNWTNSRTKPTPEVLREWATLCRVPLGWLVTGRDDWSGSMQAHRLVLLTQQYDELRVDNTGWVRPDGSLVMAFDTDAADFVPTDDLARIRERPEVKELCAIRDSNPEPAD